MLHFSSVMRIWDGNPYILVSRERAREIKPDWRKPLPVLVQANGKPDKPMAYQYDADW